MSEMLAASIGFIVGAIAVGIGATARIAELQRDIERLRYLLGERSRGL